MDITDGSNDITQNNGSTGRKKKHSEHSSGKPPKGILKNSNPNATYHKRHHRRKLDELGKLHHSLVTFG